MENYNEHHKIILAETVYENDGRYKTTYKDLHLKYSSYNQAAMVRNHLQTVYVSTKNIQRNLCVETIINNNLNDENELMIEQKNIEENDLSTITKEDFINCISGLSEIKNITRLTKEQLQSTIKTVSTLAEFFLLLGSDYKLISAYLINKWYELGKILKSKDYKNNVNETEKW